MATRRVYASSRDRILDAAEKLLIESGLSGVSVESVATAAGVSKGAFFHHFKTKDAMLTAILDRFIEWAAKKITARAAEDQETRGAQLRAQIKLNFEESDQLPKGLILALLQVATSQPSFRRRAQTLNAATIARDVGEDIPVGHALAVQLALDGVALWEILGMKLPVPQRNALRDTLMALAQPQASARRRRKAKPASSKGRRT